MRLSAAVVAEGASVTSAVVGCDVVSFEEESELLPHPNNPAQSVIANTPANNRFINSPPMPLLSRFGIIILYQNGIILSREHTLFLHTLQSAFYSFGENAMRLKELRKAKKMTQQRLAIELNMNQNTLSRYETGERQADYQTLILIADYFDVSIDYLLERTDNPKFIK